MLLHIVSGVLKNCSTCKKKKSPAKCVLPYYLILLPLLYVGIKLTWTTWTMIKLLLCALYSSGHGSSIYMLDVMLLTNPLYLTISVLALCTVCTKLRSPMTLLFKMNDLIMTLLLNNYRISFWIDRLLKSSAFVST